jgi:hypothetical protein
MIYNHVMRSRTRWLWVVLVLCLLVGLNRGISFAQSDEPRFFPETGHWVSGDFLAKYESVPNPELVFGMPLTGQFPAADIGREAGLHFVYAGNLPGRVGEYEDTFCPGCNQPVVRRSGYTVREYRITRQGTCANCGTNIPGVWPDDPASVQLNGFGSPISVY